VRHDDFKMQVSTDSRACEFPPVQAAPASVASYWLHDLPLLSEQSPALPHATAPGHSDAYVAIAALQAELMQEMHVDCADVGFWQVKVSFAAPFELEQAGARLTVKVRPTTARNGEERMRTRVLGEWRIVMALSITFPSHIRRQGPDGALELAGTGTPRSARPGTHAQHEPSFPGRTPLRWSNQREPRGAVSRRPTSVRFAPGAASAACARQGPDREVAGSIHFGQSMVSTCQTLLVQRIATPP
jgi:hypothetical protein